MLEIQIHNCPFKDKKIVHLQYIDKDNGVVVNRDAIISTDRLSVGILLKEFGEYLINPRNTDN